MAWPNILVCVAGVLTVWSTDHVSALVEVKHLNSLYLPYNLTSTGPQFNLSSDAVEKSSYDPKEKIIYAAGYEVLHVIDSADATKLILLYSKFFEGFDLTDVAVCADVVLITADNQDSRLDGQLMVFKKHKRGSTVEIELLKSVPVGAKPDMIYPLEGCKKVLIALEGDAFYDDTNKFVNPEGAVAMVSWPNGPLDSAQSVKIIDFKAFNSKVAELVPTGVRYVYQDNSTLSTDLEPEYIALDPANNKAYICLQENNGIAELDLVSETVTRIHGLGYKQWGVFDASDRDLGIQLSSWPTIRAWYQPDAIQFASWKGRQLVFSANEGKLKKYVNFREYQRGKQFTGLGDQIPEVVKTWLQKDSQLGRLKMSKSEGKDDKGLYQALYTFGARSFSIWDAADNFKQLYDSGSDIETYTALKCPHAFNTEGDDIDEKSDSKGPEVEAVAVGQIGDRLYVFLGTENPGIIVVYSIGENVTQPRFEAIFCDGLPDDKRTLQEKYDARAVYALDAEDIKFYNATDSPTGSPILVVVGAVSGTVSILSIVVS